MSEIQKYQNQTLTVWEDKENIRRQFAPTLTEIEFDFFMALGQAMQMNPYKREIWAVKFGNNAAHVFIGRDGYRKTAQSLQEYERHFSCPIFENDKFVIKNGMPEHESSNFAKRGILIGAYACVYTKPNILKFWVKVELSEYNLSQSVWKTKPQTMICKVAEAQALRGAFQGTFAGTYDESENWTDAIIVDDKKPVNKVKVIEPKKEEAKPIVLKLPKADIEMLLEGFISPDDIPELIAKSKDYKAEIESYDMKSQFRAKITELKSLKKLDK